MIPTAGQALALAMHDGLGYRPAFTLAAGMQLTEQWARRAGLLD